ncbi:MAG: demethoxyubiquinone hydroxylase family protein [Anaerohalosphaeraceae bacterium]
MNPSENAQYDVTILRPAIRKEDIALRGRQLSPSELARVKKALRTLHNLEIMATNVYRFQITGKRDEMDEEMIRAMCNEQTHISDFLLRLYEYGLSPSPIRWTWWIVGFVFGFGSRLLGQKAMLNMGIWLESKAVHHYGELLNAAPWDEATRMTLEKDRADEVGHINTWRKYLAQINT